MEKKRLSVCFADQENYLKVIEKIGEEDAINLIQDAFKTAGDIIFQNGGKIVKYLGDAILFYFEDTKTAVKSAELIAKCFNKKIDGIDIGFAVSVATGDVYLTKIGHPKCSFDDIMGTTVNKAALLIKQTRESDDRIALCPETKAANSWSKIFFI